jgi:hypothetical protein
LHVVPLPLSSKGDEFDFPDVPALTNVQEIIEFHQYTPSDSRESKEEELQEKEFIPGKNERVKVLFDDIFYSGTATKNKRVDKTSYVHFDDGLDSGWYE